MSRQIPQNDDDSCTDEHGRQRTDPIPADRADNSADERGRGVEVFHKHVGSIACENVSQDPSADAGDYADENRKVGISVRNMDIGCLDTDDGKESKPDRIHNAEQYIVKGMLLHLEMVPVEHKYNDTNADRRQSEDRIAKSGRGSDVQYDIPDDSAADCCGHGQHCNAKDIHFLLNSDDSAGNGKGYCADQFKKEKHIESSP